MTSETEVVLLREDEQAAYPVVSGIPVLLAPEVLSDPRVQRAFNLGDLQYAEAYLEMEFYNSVGFRDAKALRESGSLLAVEDSESLQHIERLRLRPALERSNFPRPPKVWLHSRLRMVNWAVFNSDLQKF